jgi:hypothetical protein
MHVCGFSEYNLLGPLVRRYARREDFLEGIRGNIQRRTDRGAAMIA